MQQGYQRRRAWIISIIAHLLLLVILGISFKFSNYTEEKKSAAAQPIQVHTVSEKTLQQQQRAIAQEKAAKFAAIRAKQRRIAAQKRKAKILAQKRAAAKARAKRLAQQRAAAQAKAKLVAQQQAAAKVKRIAQQKAAAAKAKQIAQQKAAAAARAKQLAQQKKLIAQRKAIQSELQRKSAALLQQMQMQQMQKDAFQVNKVITAHNNAIIDKYKARILSKIAQNWLVPRRRDADLSSKFTVNLAPGGVVLSVSLDKSSGVAALDISAKTAIMKSSPLPVPKDPALFDKFRVLSLTVRPEDVLQG